MMLSVHILARSDRYYDNIETTELTQFPPYLEEYNHIPKIKF